jgi:hypothetical protein
MIPLVVVVLAFQPVLFWHFLLDERAIDLQVYISDESSGFFYDGMT